MAQWTAAFINDLPDSSFLFIAPGGKKDEGGKTVPRSLRYFPVRDAQGAIDLPHLRNALSRIPQAQISTEAKRQATEKARKMLQAEQMSITLSAPLDPATPPDRLLLFKKGPNETAKGTFLFDDDAARQVMAAYEAHGTELAFDYDHAMVSGASPRDRVAAGWFKLAVEDGALWATDIRWTPTALKQIQDREWRYTSPAFLAMAGEGEKPRRITKILNVALTNLPATVGIEPIAAHDDTAGDDTEQSMTDTLSTELVALTGHTDPEVARATILSWKTKAERVDTLETEVKGLRAEADKAKFDALVIEALSDGRLIPANREAFEKLHAEHGLPAASAALAILPKASTRVVEPPKGESVETLSDSDREIMSKYNITEAAMLASKKRDARKGA